MYEREEEKMEELRRQLEQQPLPTDRADAAILQGLEQAKREKQKMLAKRKRSLWTIAAAAILVLVLITSIRVSPTFANAVASIPGLDRFVELIQDDKGLQSVFENEYFESIGASETIDNATLTIDGVILDESGMNIFYTVESAAELDEIVLDTPVLHNEDGEVEMRAATYHSFQEERSKNIFQDMIGYHFMEPVGEDTLTFRLDLQTKLNGKEFAFSVPFDVTEAVQASTEYTVAEELEVEGQRFTIDRITVYPLRIAVHITPHPDNTKKILQYEDLRIENGDGEIWGIQQGLSSFGNEPEGETRTFFLQSNYFEQPDGLYFHISRLQAVDKEDAHLIIDTDTGELLHSPKNGKVELISADRSLIALQVDVPEDGLHYGIIGSAVDASGEPLDPEWSSHGFVQEVNAGREELKLRDLDYENPISLELFAYPAYIEKDIRVNLEKVE